VVTIPLTARLRGALKAHRHLRGELVFCHNDGRPFSQSAIEAALRPGSKRAGLRRIGMSFVTRSARISRCATEGDSGASRTLDAEHDASVHASRVERAQ
jgi:hypothetical protein